MGKRNLNSNSACSTEIPFGWTETETDRSILSYPSDVPNLMESLDSGHATVKTENSQPGLSQGQDPSSRVLLRSTRVATRGSIVRVFLVGGVSVGGVSVGASVSIVGELGLGTGI